LLLVGQKKQSSQFGRTIMSGSMIDRVVQAARVGETLQLAPGEYDELRKLVLRRLKDLPVSNPGDVRPVCYCAMCSKELKPQFHPEYISVSYEILGGISKGTSSLPVSKKYVYHGYDNIFCTKTCGYEFGVQSARRLR